MSHIASYHAPTPVVVQFCEQLQAPENGQVTVPSTLQFSVATYTCDLGFMLDGNSMRTCLQNADTIPGVWSGEDPACPGR